MYEHASEPSSAQRSSPSPACVIISQTDRSPRLPSSSRSRNPHTRPYFAALGVPSQYAVKVVMVCVPPPWNLRNFKLSGMLSRDKLPNGNTILRMSRSRTGRRVRKSPDFHVFLDLVLARARCSYWQKFEMRRVFSGPLSHSSFLMNRRAAFVPADGRPRYCRGLQ